MSKVEKLVQSFKENPRNRRYEVYIRVIKHYGGKVTSSGSSHRAAKFPGGPRIIFVEPHGNNEYMHPDEIKKLLIALNELGEVEL